MTKVECHDSGMVTCKEKKRKKCQHNTFDFCQLHGHSLYVYSYFVFALLLWTVEKLQMP